MWHSEEANRFVYRSLPEDEEDGAAEAEGGPDEVETEFLAHEKQGEGDEDGERDDVLHDLQVHDMHGSETSWTQKTSRG